MRKALLLLLLILVLSLTAVSFVAADGDAAWGCPDQFHLHMAMDHDGHHGPHRHVGNDTDRNGDGWICVKHVGVNGDIHVHIDNQFPLP